MGARSRTDDMRAQCEAEIRLVDVELRKIDDATDRYLAAFEDGTMPQAQCGTRLRGLGTKAVELRARKEELGGRLTAVSAEAPTEEQLVALRRRIREVIETGPPSVQKLLVRELVHEIRVPGRDRIQPVFRVPNREHPPFRRGLPAV